MSKHGNPLNSEENFAVHSIDLGLGAGGNLCQACVFSGTKLKVEVFCNVADQTKLVFSQTSVRIFVEKEMCQRQEEAKYTTHNSVMEDVLHSRGVRAHRLGSSYSYRSSNIALYLQLMFQKGTRLLSALCHVCHQWL